MISNIDTITIIDEGADGVTHLQLYIDGCRRAFVSDKNGTIRFQWEVYGPQTWPEAKVLMQGLLELSVMADHLYGVRNEKS